MLPTRFLFPLAALFALVLSLRSPAFDAPKEPTASQKAIAKKIGKGHSFQKHVVDGKEFDSLLKEKTKSDRQEEFIALIAKVMANPTHSKKLARRREAFYDNANNVIVIVDPSTRDHGTCFRPNQKKRYYDNLK
jgi:pyridoxal/pyridoxine/pyridoxamine kinase